jgi:hypothetical protein
LDLNQPKICELLKDQRFEGFLLVRTSDQRTGGNGAKYLDLNLADRTGEVNAKVWDGNAQPPMPGTIVKVRGGTLEYNGRLQLRVERIRPMADSDDVDISQLAPCAPETPDEMMGQILETVKGFKSEPIRKIVLEMLRRFDEKLQYYPAAQRIHHAERSGLLHHTTGMLKTAKVILDVYPWLNSDLTITPDDGSQALRYEFRGFSSRPEPGLRQVQVCRSDPRSGVTYRGFLYFSEDLQDLVLYSPQEDVVYYCSSMTFRNLVTEYIATLPEELS